MAPQRLAEDRAHLADALSRREPGPAELAEVGHDRHDEQRRHHEDGQGQPRVERKDVQKDEHHRQAALDEVRQPRSESGLDLLRVREQPAHQVPRRALGGEPGRLVEERAVGILPEVPDHGEADRVERELGEVREHVLDQESPEQQQGDRVAGRHPEPDEGVEDAGVGALEQAQQRRHAAGGGGSRQHVRSSRPEDLVDHLLQEKQERDRCGGDQRHRQERGQRPELVPAEVAQEAREGLHRASRRESAAGRRDDAPSAERT